MRSRSLWFAPAAERSDTTIQLRRGGGWGGVRGRGWVASWPASSAIGCLCLELRVQLVITWTMEAAVGHGRAGNITLGLGNRYDILQDFV